MNIFRSTTVEVNPLGGTVQVEIFISGYPAWGYHYEGDQIFDNSSSHNKPACHDLGQPPDLIKDLHSFTIVVEKPTEDAKDVTVNWFQYIDGKKVLLATGVVYPINEIEGTPTLYGYAKFQ